VAEDADRLLKLFDLQRLLQNSHRAFGQNPVEHFTVGVTGDDDNRQIRIRLFRHIVDIIGWPIR